MPTPKVPDDVVRVAGDVYLQHGTTAGARKLGLSRNQMSRRVREAIRRGFVVAVPPHQRGAAAAAAVDENVAREREAFLRANQRGYVGVNLPPAALEDLRYFGEQAKMGRAIRTAALLNWIRSKHGVQIGQTRLHAIAIEAGITPWWSAGR
jgi:hypothetical protein